MELVYKNLVIRKAVGNDAEQLCVWWNDGRIMAQMGLPNGVGCKPEDVRKSLDENKDKYRHIIELDGKPIGEMNNRDMNGEKGTAEPGIKICDFSEQNKGYGTILLTIFIDALFRYYNYEKVILDTGIKNERAQYVYEKKLGFRHIMTEKNDDPDELGIYEHIVYFEMNKADWLASQNEPLDYTHSYSAE